jgi:hypothetical protein
MMPPSKDCITNGCNNRISLLDFLDMCYVCYSKIPKYIPFDQFNLYSKLKSEKENRGD